MIQEALVPEPRGRLWLKKSLGKESNLEIQTPKFRGTPRAMKGLGLTQGPLAPDLESTSLGLGSQGLGKQRTTMIAMIGVTTCYQKTISVKTGSRLVTTLWLYAGYYSITWLQSSKTSTNFTTQNKNYDHYSNAMKLGAKFKQIN